VVVAVDLPAVWLAERREGVWGVLSVEEKSGMRAVACGRVTGGNGADDAKKQDRIHYTALHLHESYQRRVLSTYLRCIVWMV
jgi:hypothetical protein